MRLTNSGIEYDTAPTRFERLKMKCKELRWSDLKTTKFLISTTTTIFALTGLLLLILGIIVLGNYNEYYLFLGPYFFVVPRFVIVTAVFIFFTAVLGFYGAISEKYKIVLAYLALLVTILIFELSITILAFQLEEDAFGYINQQIQRDQFPFSDRSFLLAWDDLQREKRCCGIYGRGKYDIHPLPITCCYIPAGARSPFECTTDNAYYATCDSRLSHFMGKYAYIIGVVAATVTCLQVIIVAVVSWIAYRLKSKKKIPQHGFIMKDTLKIEPPNPSVIDYSRF
ncbi:leukocyte surface antigen CD53-like [Maniola jurtina]|uniref:leukocyte surface antigen CD53-like n=1 Tax=Maniola jurtina TaxID=191418 RepID=UPI001E68A5CD|nr:leukocyte surface antigen CD53-like [Maniola jurtina]